ncbi:nucleoside deaminase [Natronogracilivirgula saccharolytica]|uniref:tRNA-specific adenosine deaminase n=2 Tax=Natronogracilivirga saccharolytica TaxID=2812953 RepID=A0A8J7UWI6_9BACT|nr:nucleoside deaminase [Natronogracilivirga saccharolytica]
MNQAFHEAQKAADAGDIPVGAVIVHENRIVARGHNQVELLNDPTAHAEMIALSAAFEYFNEKYLSECCMYVTLEPCAMCAGALVWSKIGHVIFGAQDAQAGACGSLFNIASNDHLNHRVKLVQGVMEQECEALLHAFFSDRRDKKSKK